jgi:iron complex transport system substrate-binding protein
MAQETKQRSNSTGKFILVLVAVLAVIVVAIEWSRRARTQDSPTAVAGSPAPHSFPRELRDAAGEMLVIADQPKRIASQTLGTDEILLAICPPERIVALSSLAEDENYSNVVEEARRLAGRTAQGAEQILHLQPDLIFVASYSRAETVQLLKASRAPVFRFANFNSIADIKGNIRTVGCAVGNDAEAEALIQKMDEALAAARARVPPGQPPLRVMSFGQSGYTGGANTTFDDMVRAAGAINASAEHGIEGFAKISAEKVIEWQPDFIVAGANRGEIESVRRNLLADPVIAASRAGLADRIIVIDNRHFLTVSQYVVRGVEDLADGLYGKRQ